MDDRTLGGIFDRAAQDFVGQGSRIAFTKKDVTHDIDHRVDVGPVKVDVGDASGGLLEVNEQRGDGIGDRGAPGVEDATGPFANPLDAEDIR